MAVAPQTSPEHRGQARPAATRAFSKRKTVRRRWPPASRSEEHTSELQSLRHLVCRLLLEKKKNNRWAYPPYRKNIDYQSFHPESRQCIHDHSPMHTHL